MNAQLREQVRRRAGHRCEYCRTPQSALPFQTFHVEHVRALQHGGRDELTNLAFACERCNLLKGPNLSAVDPASSAVVLLFDPRTMRWHEHFRQVDSLLTGTTPIGRATVALLNMNDPRRVELRKTLRLILDP